MREFTYRLTAAGAILINWGGREVRRVTGAHATELTQKLAAADDAEKQKLLAVATGNFKRGTERPDLRR